MSKTKESNLYTLIKKTIKNAHFTRIESNTLNIPSHIPALIFFDLTTIIINDNKVKTNITALMTAKK